MARGRSIGSGISTEALIDGLITPPISPLEPMRILLDLEAGAKIGGKRRDILDDTNARMDESLLLGVQDLINQCAVIGNFPSLLPQISNRVVNQMKEYARLPHMYQYEQPPQEGNTLTPAWCERARESIATRTYWKLAELNIRMEKFKERLQVIEAGFQNSGNYSKHWWQNTTHYSWLLAMNMWLQRQTLNAEVSSIWAMSAGRHPSKMDTPGMWLAKRMYASNLKEAHALATHVALQGWRDPSIVGFRYIEESPLTISGWVFNENMYEVILVVPHLCVLDAAAADPEETQLLTCTAMCGGAFYLKLFDTHGHFSQVQPQMASLNKLKNVIDPIPNSLLLRIATTYLKWYQHKSLDSGITAGAARIPHTLLPGTTPNQHLNSSWLGTSNFPDYIILPLTDEERNEMGDLTFSASILPLANTSSFDGLVPGSQKEIKDVGPVLDNTTLFIEKSGNLAASHNWQVAHWTQPTGINPGQGIDPPDHCVKIFPNVHFRTRVAVAPLTNTSLHTFTTNTPPSLPLPSLKALVNEAIQNTKR